MSVNDGRFKKGEQTQLRHGHAIKGKMSKTYKVWLGMRKRCNSPNSIGYPDYGGRGITVCKRWDKFENFLADMGECPPGLTIDRKNNNGNYHKRNCRWATQAQQSMNKRQRRGSRFITYKGERLCLRDWEIRLGLKPQHITKRLNAGWSERRAVSTPCL